MVIFIGDFVWRITKKVISLHRNQKRTQLIKGKNKKSPEHFQTKQRIKRTTMTEKERKEAASKAFQVLEDAVNKVDAENVNVATKVIILRKFVGDGDPRFHLHGTFKVMALAEQIEGACRFLSSVAPLIERLLWDGEADQFEELIEMVEETKSEAYRCAYEIGRIFDLVLSKK